MPKRINITGQRFHKWLVLHREPSLTTAIKKETYWLCQCDCGITKPVRTRLLVHGESKSCGGCGKGRHNKTFSPEYTCWNSMRMRCTNPKNKDWHRYGGRGITVCERWNTFENFYNDMGSRPTGYTLDRIDVNGNYEPSNCRWLPKSENTKARRPQSDWVTNPTWSGPIFNLKELQELYQCQ
jgi:hypothetical protein